MVEAENEECFLNSRLERARKLEQGFAGATHALSAFAVMSIIIAFASDNFYSIIETDNVYVVIMCVIVVVGFSLVVDLDGVQSLARSALSFLGVFISKVMRAVSLTVQQIVSSKYDEDTHNPHRKLWHTAIVWVVCGFLFFLLFSVSTTVSLPFFGERQIGWFFAVFVVYLSFQISMVGLFHKEIKKIKNKMGLLGEIGIDVFSLIITLVLMKGVPEDMSFKWLSVAIVLGAYIHLAGDMLTKMGIPLFFPIKIKGKRWYNVRLAKLESGGVVEKSIFYPLFICAIVISALSLIGFSPDYYLGWLVN